MKGKYILNLLAKAFEIITLLAIIGAWMILHGHGG
jgi:hypothetical protein